MTDTTKDILIKAARDDFPAFAEIMCGYFIPGLVWGPYLDLVSARTEAIIAGDIRRLVINLPPRHLKTMVASVMAGAWALGKNPRMEILCVSHSNTLARDIADKSLQVMNHPFYRECFPATKIRDDRGSVTDFATTAGGSRLSASFDTGVTGRGADLIFVDDPLSAQDSASEKERENKIRSFDQMVATRLNDPRSGAILLIAQRLHENDLSGHLLENAYSHLRLPFEAEDDECYEYKGGVFHRRRGEVLQPERFGPSEIEQLKQSTPPHIFATQYQQQPTAISAGTVRREDFLRFDPPAPRGDIICSWDVASGTNTSSSKSVCLVFQGNEHGSYLIDVFRGSEEYGSLKTIALELHQRYNPRLHLIEDASLGRALGSELRQHSANAIMLPTGGASKLDRLLAQLHLIKGQRVFLPKTAPWLETFLDEVVAFPHGSRDDQVDALTQYLKWYGDRLNEPPVPKHVSVGIGHGAHRSARMRDMNLRNTPMRPPSPTGGLRRRL